MQNSWQVWPWTSFSFQRCQKFWMLLLRLASPINNTESSGCFLIVMVQIRLVLSAQYWVELLFVPIKLTHTNTHTHLLFTAYGPAQWVCSFPIQRRIKYSLRTEDGSPRLLLSVSGRLWVNHQCTNLCNIQEDQINPCRWKDFWRLQGSGYMGESVIVRWKGSPETFSDERGESNIILVFRKDL